MCAAEGNNRALDFDVKDLQEALNALYELLEAHAPMWYEEVHRAKATAALRFVSE